MSFRLHRSRCGAKSISSWGRMSSLEEDTAAMINSIRCSSNSGSQLSYHKCVKCYLFICKIFKCKQICLSRFSLTIHKQSFSNKYIDLTTYLRPIKSARSGSPIYKSQTRALKPKNSIRAKNEAVLKNESHSNIFMSAPLYKKAANNYSHTYDRKSVRRYE